MNNWYNIVYADLSKIPDFISFFEKEIDISKSTEMSLKGKTLEKHCAELPGIVENRFAQLQEIEAVLELLNIQYKQEKSDRFKFYLQQFPKALSSRDAEKYAEGDPLVVNRAILVNEVALLRNKYLSLMKGLDSKNWMVGHIVKLRCAGLDDAQI
ncbi:hypothetical protein MIJ3_00055 [Pseudomonas phage vB_PaeM_MIJ3]|uniref:Uncharacterized protein n=1 Tax=Pseudomonas phage vB_PaeM_PA5oct TaxID=2163605 RepID=A0A4Y1LUS3_9CAUD|nr:hypothetical protein PQE65_gp270 [Pseudomonas phage vB_PaeM_PA5oct]WMI31758.1 hypothetical protein GBBBJNDB_00055 [Pseudomonas phage Callisto]WPK38687.1 hypothetical protein Cassandra_0011 [Pseudomonas phage Cassandra]WPK39208.1 hypothetical protein Deiofobo_0011 [Pseudomonas phage Deifobo]WPK39720.1 hypothetical protein ETTORE_0011 [Pseudomonas phage Ettore]WPK40241.1 hypothetical protein Paride_0011 [Pseudomonas phage Paride]VOH53775.1 hypothetical protein MIJ3_00055 [Pseudomonas phage v